MCAFIDRRIWLANKNEMTSVLWRNETRLCVREMQTD